MNIKRTTAWLIGVFILLPQVNYAQKVRVTGKIIDKSSKEAIPNVIVSVENNVQTALTDSLGAYVLELEKGKYQLKYQSIGYQTQVSRVAITDTLPLQRNVVLVPTAIHLDEVTVTARNEARQLRESSMPVSVMTSKELEGTASSINEVLARTAGVTIRNTGGVGSASRMSVRGLEGKRLGLFIDEIAIGQMSNFVSLNDIPTDMIERIEVYKGIVPYKFGGSALGGAVNVVTKEYPPIYFDASYEIASFNTHRLSTVLKRTHKPSGLQFGIGGFFTYSDNNYVMTLHNLNDRRVKRNHDTFKKYILGGSLKATKWWFDELKLECSYTNTHQEIQGIDLDVREAFNKSNSVLGELSAKKEQFFIDGLAFDFDLAYSYGKYGLVDKALQVYDWDGNVRPSQSPYGGETGIHPYDGHNVSHNIMAKLNLNYTLDQHNSINLNIHEAHTRLLPCDSLMDKSFGFRTQFNSRMNSLTAGLSYDLMLLNNKFQNAFTLRYFLFNSKTQQLPSFYVSTPETIYLKKNYIGWNESMRYRITPSIMVKASYSNEVRIPTTEELLGNGYSILPSPDLAPERVQGVNIGALYRKKQRNEGYIEAEVNLFYNQLKEMVRYMPTMIPTMAKYVNFGETTTYGIEGELKLDAFSWLYVYGNASYQDLRDSRKVVKGSQMANPTYKKRIPNVPYLLANAGFEMHKENLFGGKENNTRLLVDASYIHQYFYDFEMSIYQDRKIPTSFTFDAGLEHSIMNRKLTFTLKVKNVFNRETVTELNRPLPGRSIALKVRYLLR